MRLKRALIALTLVGCGVTEATNPGDDKKPTGGKLGFFAFDLSSVKMPEGSRLKLGFKSDASPDQDKTVDYEAASESSYVQVAAGTYTLEAAASTGSKVSQQTLRINVEQSEAKTAEEFASDRQQRLCSERERILAQPVYTNFGIAKMPVPTSTHIISTIYGVDVNCAGKPVSTGDSAQVALPVTVVVTEPNVSLVLLSRAQIRWNIVTEDPGSVASIVLSGEISGSEITGVPPEVPAVRVEPSSSVPRLIGPLVMEPEQYAPLGNGEGAGCDVSEPLPRLFDYDVTLAQALSAIGSDVATSVQARIASAKYVVDSKTLGEYLVIDRTIGACYKNADGSITPFEGS